MWQRFRDVAAEYDLVTWPDAPIRYVPIPTQTRIAAPRLYYLFYRSPAPFDPPGIHDYVVSPIDGLPDVEVNRRLEAAHDCAIALNHVVHHGGLGHHVQNWFAYRSASRIGQVARSRCGEPYRDVLGRIARRGLGVLCLRSDGGDRRR